MVVCKSWHSCLHPRRLPIHECCLEQGSVKLADWVFQMEPSVQKMAISLEYEHRPTLESPHFQACYNALVSLHPRAALEELKLSGNPNIVNSLLRVLRPFPSLTYLQLTGTPYQVETELEGRLLCSLPALRKLVVSDGSGFALEGSAPLRHLQHLEVHEVEWFRLNAALPRLQTLVVDRVDDVRVGGDQLQLPALTRLSVRSEPYAAAAVPLGRLPALQELSLRGMVSGMAEVEPPHSLTSLQLACYNDTEQLAAGQLLRSAAESVQRLELECLDWDYDQIGVLEPGPAAALGACTNLIALALRASGPLPTQLGALPRLQVLRLNSPVEGLTIAEIKRLGQLRQLQRLVVAAGQAQGGEEAVVQSAIEFLKHALPAGCTVELE